MKQWLALSLLLPVMLALVGCGGGGNQNTVTLRVIDMDGRPTTISALAFQDGDGPWSAIPSQIGAEYTFTVIDPAHRFGIAFTGGFNQLFVYQGTTTELPLVTCQLPFSRVGANTLTGTVLGLSAENHAEIHVGHSSDWVMDNQNEYTLQNVSDGTHSLFAALYPDTSSLSIPTKIVVKRDLTLTDSTYLPVYFVSASNAQIYDLTVLGGTVYTAFAQYIAADGPVVGLGDTSGNILSYAAVPTTPMVGEYYAFYITMAGEDKESYFLSAYPPVNKHITVPDTNPVSYSYVDHMVTWDNTNRPKVYDLYVGETDTQAIFHITSGWLQGAKAYTIPTFEELETKWTSEGMLTGTIYQTRLKEIISESSTQAIMQAHTGKQAPTRELLYTVLGASEE